MTRCDVHRVIAVAAVEEVMKHAEVFDYLHCCKYPSDADKTKREALGKQHHCSKSREGACLERDAKTTVPAKKQQEQIFRSCHDDCLGQCYIHKYKLTYICIHLPSYVYL